MSVSGSASSGCSGTTGLRPVWRPAAQAKEVHLEQAQVRAGRVVGLGNDRAVGLPLPDRDVIDDRLAAHDHAGRVHARLADQPLEPARGVDDLADLLLALVQPADLAGLAVAGAIGVEAAGQ